MGRSPSINTYFITIKKEEIIIKILTILLNWNRPELVKTTIESYYKNTSVDFKFIVADNGSNFETVSLLEELSIKYDFEVEYLKKNTGGLAFNYVLDRIPFDSFPFIHFTENDIEYLQNWDHTLLKKMKNFPEVGQISPFSPFPQTDKGEYSWEKAATKVTRNGNSVYLSKHNVGSTSIIRSEILIGGLRWSNIKGKDSILFPNDGLFSRRIKEMGWKAAYNDSYVVNNLGHTLEELENNLEYYVNNHQSKSFDRFKKRIGEFGFVLHQDSSGKLTLRKKNNF
ncbi:glycosyltransferase family 2 protein [Evansella tamaricis]|uniref:Glycosyltransferase n=1 Tax=Evansella tamaricis TaxID=2069301 RepID=A0ABS6JJC1_9BACI|nr:glycosyltransferase [Evansella tamaricis]